jgi:hypothetical protein
MPIEDKETYITLAGKSFTKTEFEDFILLMELSFITTYFFDIPVLRAIKKHTNDEEELKCMLN